MQIRDHVAEFTHETKSSTPTPKKATATTPSSSMTAQNGSPSYQSRLPFQSTAPNAMNAFTAAGKTVECVRILHTDTQQPESGSRRVRFIQSFRLSLLSQTSNVCSALLRNLVLHTDIKTEKKEPFELSVVLSAETIEDLKANESNRVMLYCAVDNGLNMYAASEIAFPPAVELRINEGPVKANLRGLKNKPGTTRPVDITKSLRIMAGYHNRISIGVFPPHTVGHEKPCSGLN